MSEDNATKTPDSDRSNTAARKQGYAERYAQKRRDRIGEHSRDDNFLIFVGVAVVVMVGSLIAWWVVRDMHSEEEMARVPVEPLFYGSARETTAGRVEVSYDFAIDPNIVSLREACPQLRDWTITGTVDNAGILVSADNRYRPFFTGDDIAVECDAAVVKGSQIAIDFCSLYDNMEGDFYRLELSASLGEGWAPRAQIVHFKEGGRLPGPSCELPELKVSRRPSDPPTWYRIRFEQVGKVLRAYFGPKGGKLVKVSEIKAADIVVGTIKLRGPGSLTAFDNVVVFGKPHPQFVEKRSKLYYLFNMDKLDEGTAESEAPLADPSPESEPVLNSAE